MAFIAKPDYFNLATSISSSLSLKSSSLNKSASVAEATDEKGDVVADTMFGERAAPSVVYEVIADLDLSDITLGAITTVDGKPYALTSVNFNTAPAGVPEVQCSGEQVESGATTSNSTTIEVPEITLKKWHDAQILGAAFALTGTGCYLNGCNYSVKCDITFATVDGTIVAHDVQNGRIEVAVTIVQTGSTAPTVAAAAANGWEVTSPLTTDNPDEDYPTWTCTVTKYLTSAHPATT